MRITDFHIDGFGVWSDLTAEQLPDQLTVLYGRNEAGKTTLMQFLRSMLYGFRRDSTGRYLPPVHGTRSGGSLDLANQQGCAKIVRRITRHSSEAPQEHLEVILADGVTEGHEQLDRCLQGIDESIFHHVFSLGLQEMQELGALNRTDAAQLLYKLASGMDRVSLIDVVRDLTHERGALLGGEAEDEWKIVHLYDRRRQLKRQIDELQSQSSRWAKVVAQSAQISDQLDEIKQNCGELEWEARVVELALQVMERWQSRQSIQQQIDALGSLPDPRDVSIPRLEKIKQKIVEQRTRISELKRQRLEIKQQASELPINRALCGQGCRIEAIQEHQPWIVSLQNQIRRLSDESEQLQHELGIHTDDLGVNSEHATNEIPEISDQMFQGLRMSARALKKAKRRLERVKQHHDQAEQATAQQLEEFETALVDQGCDDLSESLESAGKLVNLLQRRLEIEQRIDKLGVRRKELEADINDALDGQILPRGKTLAAGGLVIGGTALALAGLAGWFLSFLPFMPLLGVLGIAIAVFGVVIKFVWEGKARTELERCRSEFELVRQQIQRARQDREQLDEQLPTGLGSLDQQRVEAEARLTQLEALLPMETQMVAAQQAVEQSEQLVQKAEEGVEAAQKNWRTSLRRSGLPESMTPNRVRDLSERSEKIRQVRTRLQQCQQELEQRQQELDTLTDRIEQIIEETNLEIDESTPQGQLKHLASTLQQQRALVEQRRELAGEYRNLKRQFEQRSKSLERLRGVRERMFHQVGVEDEEAYRQIAHQLQQHEQLTQQRQSLTDQIDAAISDAFDKQDVFQQLESDDRRTLEQRWESLLNQLQQAQDEQSQLHEQRGQLTQELETLVQDRQLDQVKFELASVQQQLEQAIHQWQSLSAASLVLESLRKTYEAERQPETLRVASRYFSKMTQKRYQRIWTRLEGDTLYVDSADKKMLPVEVLSRGTREAVYLSLRLALISEYAKRRIQLPIILDDVLVNFDTLRAQAAAQVLIEFAKEGHQVLVFTCHEHMSQLFQTLGADVRTLPDHRQGKERQPLYLRKAVEPPAPVTVAEEIQPAPVQLEKEESILPTPAPDAPPALAERVVSESVDEPTSEPEDHWITEQPEPSPIAAVSAETSRTRFQWNFPDMWWDDSDEEAA